MQENPLQIKEKIVKILKIRGPCLPIHVSREIGISTLFSSAFLSELASEKTIKISNLKVGGSPLYFLPGQEFQIEKFSNYLPEKEKEAFLLLKQKKLLQDNKLEPAIRVALRNLKDFAFPFINNTEQGQVLFWRFHSFSELETEKILKELRLEKEEVKVKIPEIPAGIKIEKKREIEKPLITLKEKKEKVEEKSGFVKKTVSFLEKENIELLDEKEAKKKEFTGTIRINSDIGKIKFLCIAKDKKSITENDLTLALQKAQALKMPALFLSTGQLNKKAQAYLETYSSLIKFKQI